MNEFQEQRVAWQNQALKRGLWSSCLNCLHWEKQERGCTKFGATPPYEVVVTGCKDWVTEIPF